LITWITAQAGGNKVYEILEGHPSLPPANDFLDANTVFFRQMTSGKPEVRSVALPSREHAEMVFKLAQLGLHGPVRLPAPGPAMRALKGQFEARLSGLTTKANQLACSRTSDERRAADVTNLLHRWMVHGKPRSEPPRPEGRRPSPGATVSGPS
jgi:hypothetical protein